MCVRTPFLSTTTNAPSSTSICPYWTKIMETLSFMGNGLRGGNSEVPMDTNSRYSLESEGSRRWSTPAGQLWRTAWTDIGNCDDPPAWQLKYPPTVAVSDDAHSLLPLTPYAAGSVRPTGTILSKPRPNALPGPIPARRVFESAGRSIAVRIPS